MGSRLAPDGTDKEAGPDDLAKGRVPLKLANTCVLIDSQRAPVLSVTPSLVTAIVLADVNGEVSVQVVANCEQDNESKGGAVNATVQEAAAEFILWSVDEAGAGPIRGVNADSGRNIGPDGLVAGLEFSPAKVGDAVVLTAIGLGRTSPAIEAGQSLSEAAPIILPVEILLEGGRTDTGRYSVRRSENGCAGYLRCEVPDSREDAVRKGRRAD